MSDEEVTKPTNFIRQIIDEDLASGKHQSVHTRFPPEPNGYLHIGHAKSIALNFEIGADYQGKTNLRFDDTNPAKEEGHFVEAIKHDVEWLGYEWDELHFASDYFEQLYQFAIELIEAGKAYVCDLDAEQVREYRGNLTKPGKDSPTRNRSVAENLDLFKRMRAGEFEDGSHTLRAKIDMASPNMVMRDPALYRIRKGLTHHQVGTVWSIYPMYDFTHPISDAIEGITHSLCTLEFEGHRPLYDWLLDNISIDCHPQQIEFSRLNLEYTVMSKRKLTQLVDEKHVDGWDDPRLPTIAGMRRRGYTPGAIRHFCRAIGVTKVDGMIEMGMLESAVRSDLEDTAPRRMAVLDPIKIIITNFEEGKIESLQGPNHPKDESMGTRELFMTREVYIDRDDFRESANKKYKRLVLEKEVRLRNSYVIQANEVIKDENGEVLEVHCTYDPATLGVNPEGRKVKGVIQWVSVDRGMPVEVHQYDRLFSCAMPGKEGDFLDDINPDSLKILDNCVVEASLSDAVQGERFQFEREGYFCRDFDRIEGGKPIFNQVVSLRDSWGG